MAFLLDTSVIVALERARADLGSLLGETGDEPIAIAAVTAAELLHGVHRADSAVRRGQREAFVEGILALVHVLPMDLAVARHHARIWSDLQRHGPVIGAHDLIIAATALTHGLVVLTGNVREFGRVEGLAVRRLPGAPTS